MTERRKTDTRRLLLEAAAELISASPGQDVPLRAICDAVGVKLPTLYHFFGSKEGLLDAVIEHGFDTYLAAKADVENSDDPIVELRAGWDAHVAFGLANTGFYALMYGQVRPRHRPTAAQRPFDALLRICARAHDEHRLSVRPEQAAEEILAANIGVTLFLITARTPDPEVSVRLREATIAGITDRRPNKAPDVPVAELAQHLLRELSTAASPLATEEIALLRRWLAAIAEAPPR